MIECFELETVPQHAIRCEDRPEAAEQHFDTMVKIKDCSKVSEATISTPPNPPRTVSFPFAVSELETFPSETSRRSKSSLQIQSQEHSTQSPKVNKLVYILVILMRFVTGDMPGIMLKRCG